MVSSSWSLMGVEGRKCCLRAFRAVSSSAEIRMNRKPSFSPRRMARRRWDGTSRRGSDHSK